MAWGHEDALADFSPTHWYSIRQHPGSPASVGASGRTSSSPARLLLETQLLPEAWPNPVAATENSEPGEEQRQIRAMGRSPRTRPS